MKSQEIIVLEEQIKQLEKQVAELGKDTLLLANAQKKLQSNIESIGGEIWILQKQIGCLQDDDVKAEGE